MHVDFTRKADDVYMYVLYNLNLALQIMIANNALHSCRSFDLAI